MKTLNTTTQQHNNTTTEKQEKFIEWALGLGYTKLQILGWYKDPAKLSMMNVMAEGL